MAACSTPCRRHSKARRRRTRQAFERFLKRYGAKYPKATEKFIQDHEALLAFFDFPADH